MLNIEEHFVQVSMSSDSLTPHKAFYTTPHTATASRNAFICLNKEIIVLRALFVFRVISALWKIIVSSPILS